MVVAAAVAAAAEAGRALGRRDFDAVFDEAQALSDAGDQDGALAKYLEALELDFNHPVVLYNIGLNYKYRGAWKESFKYNRRASELRPADQATEWNLAIAATALRDWKTARTCVARAGNRDRGRRRTYPRQLRPDAGATESGWRR